MVIAPPTSYKFSIYYWAFWSGSVRLMGMVPSASPNKNKHIFHHIPAISTYAGCSHVLWTAASCGASQVRLANRSQFFGSGGIFHKKTWRLGGNPPVIHDVRITYLCVLHREFEGMIHWLTINNPSNPQQPIHSLRLAPVRLTPPNWLGIFRVDGAFWRNHWGPTSRERRQELWPWRLLISFILFHWPGWQC